MMSKRILFTLTVSAGLLAAGGVQAARNPPIPKTDVVIDIGHGGIDGGTSYGSILEKNINLDVGMRLYPMYRKMGISAGLTRASDYALSDDTPNHGSRHRRDLAQRVQVTNRLQPKLLVSLHVNWSNNRKESGPMVIYRRNHEPSKRLAGKLQEELNRVYGGMKSEPIPGKKYYLLRHTKVPAVIVEMGYMSNGQDRAKLTSTEFQKQLAEAIAKGTQAFLTEQLPTKSGSR